MKKLKPSPVSVVPSFVSTTPEPLLNHDQVAERLGVNPSTVRELTRNRSRNPIPYLKIGKYQRFRWSEVEKWLIGCQKRVAA